MLTPKFVRLRAILDLVPLSSATLGFVPQAPRPIRSFSVSLLSTTHDFMFFTSVNAVERYLEMFLSPISHRNISEGRVFPPTKESSRRGPSD